LVLVDGGELETVHFEYAKWLHQLSEKELGLKTGLRIAVSEKILSWMELMP
jgi:hypothetical protein